MNPSRWQRPIFGPMRRHRTGVPADHFPKFGDGRRVLIASGETLVLGAIPVHHTDVDKSGTWDGGKNVKNLDKDDDASVYKWAFAWVDADADPDTKGAYKFPHHDVNSDGKVGAANLAACAAVVGALNGGRGADVKAADWFKDRSAIYAHVKAHYTDGGVKADDIPDLDSMARAQTRAGIWATISRVAPFDVSTAAVGLITTIDAAVDELMEELGITDSDQSAAVTGERAALMLTNALNGHADQFGVHGAFTGTHAHAHSAMGSQGSDDSHDHSHSHKGDAVHSHSHEMAAAAPVPDRSGRTIHNLSLEERRRIDGANEVTDPTQLAAMVASAVEARGGALVAATNAAGQVVPADWHAYLCVEGVRTDDGRELVAGCCRFPDLPISLRLLIEDEGGHWGAVTCGRIDSMARMDVGGLSYIYSEGVFGSDDNGQLAELMVKEQTQRFVSIDPRDVTAEWVEVCINTSGAYPGLYGYDDDPDDMYDCWLRISDCVIGGATIVAMPALPQACITLKEVPLPEAPIANATAPAGLVASSAPEIPPAAWFANPGFHVGDPRLVRQRNGGAACPLTVTDDGQVYGHVSYWQAEHTGFLGQKVHPPHSKHNYAFFQLGLATALESDGQVVDIPTGHITMGCGHASTNPKLSQAAVIAHYDGGYGAVKMAKVCAGEDEFGIWVAGAINPERTAAEVAEFRSLNLSGDWRHMGGRSDEKEMLAVLAVPVPGFPISRVAIVAAGPDAGQPAEDGHLRAGYLDGQIVSLVASGIVRRLNVPEQLAQLYARLDKLERAVEPYRRSAARDRVGGKLLGGD